MSKTIGVIGLGSIGMRHAKNLLAMGHIVYGSDPDLEKAKELSALSGECGWFMPRPNGRFIGIEVFDGVVIASPTHQHIDQMLDCLSAGVPCFVEKPIGGSTDRITADLFDAATKKKIPIVVGYNLRHHSCVKKAVEWMNARLIGEPLWANFTCAQYNDKPTYQRDGVILNWSHEIDLALYLLGAGGVSSSSTRLSDGRDNMTDILLTHVNGCRTTIHLDYITKPEIRQFVIGGTKGNIIVDLVLRKAQLYGYAVASFDMHDNWDENYIEEIQAFIDRIDGKETLGCTGSEGLKVLEICLEVRKQAGL